MMPTSDERKQAAQDLRHYANEHGGVGIFDDLKRAVGMAGRSWSDTLCRLAELIDPECYAEADAVEFTVDSGEKLRFPCRCCSTCGNVVYPNFETYCSGCGSRITGGDGADIWEKR